MAGEQSVQEATELTSFTQLSVPVATTQQKKPVVIFVFSGPGGPGKSTVSYIIARALSARGELTAHIDADPVAALDLIYDKKVRMLSLTAREGSLKEKWKSIVQRFSRGNEEVDYTKVLTLEDLFQTHIAQRPVTSSLDIILRQPEMEINPFLRTALNKGNIKTSSPNSNQKEKLMEQIMALPEDYDFVVVDTSAGEDDWKVGFAQGLTRKLVMNERVYSVGVVHTERRGLRSAAQYFFNMMLSLVENNLIEDSQNTLQNSEAYSQSGECVSKVISAVIAGGKAMLFETAFLHKQNLEGYLGEIYRRYCQHNRLSEEILEYGLARLASAFETARKMKAGIVVNKTNESYTRRSTKGYYTALTQALNTALGYTPDLVGGIAYDDCLNPSKTEADTPLHKTDFYRRCTHLADFLIAKKKVMVCR